MKNIVFSLIFITSFFTLNADEIKGVVVEKNSKNHIGFVSIGIINTLLGTYSAVDGTFEMEIIEYKNADSLRFSCIGYHSVTFSVADFLERNNDNQDTIFLERKVTELQEVVVSEKHFNSKKIGNKISSNKIVFGLIKDWETGIIIENDKQLFLNKVFFKVTDGGYTAPDSVIFRFNIYNIKDGLPNENILLQPIYIRLSGEQLNGKNEFDLGQYNITVDGDFAATFELIDKYGKGVIYFAGWVNGKPNVWRQGVQGFWTTSRADTKKTEKKGVKLHQSLVIEVLY